MERSRECEHEPVELLLHLSQCGAEALSEYMRREVGADTRPGIVVSIATSGDLLQWHVHPAKKRRCTASWARLIAKVFHADPL